MNKVLIAVDGTKASTAVLSSFYNLVKKPEQVILLHVQKLQGRSLMLDMLGDAEMSTLKESIAGTEHKDALDEKADKILNYYKGELQDSGTVSITTEIRAGHPCDEILKVADEENVDLILLGNSGRRGLNRLISGSVAREVQKHTKVPVMVAKRPSTCEEPYSWKDAIASVSITSAIVLALFIFGTFVGR
ncbi:MAG TPA: universal stress protein [Thermodesulfovibrionales bacterium]|nr:universal stress protein [Thermodesulfovibrionales bacterium]